MLTQKQQQLLTFIEARVSETGVSPSFEEMKEAIGLKSKSGIHRLITALEERGFIRRLPHRARALEVLRPGTASGAGASNAVDVSAADNVIDAADFAARKAASEVPPSAPPADGTTLPVLGRIAAGTPIEAIQHEVDRICVPDALIGSGEHFILEVQGESMIEAGIHDGDYAIIQRRDDAPDGDIVVALVDGEEATLKTLRRRGNMIELEAANPAFENRKLPSNRVAVQGRLSGLVRKY